MHCETIKFNNKIFCFIIWELLDDGYTDGPEHVTATRQSAESKKQCRSYDIIISVVFAFII